MTQLSYARRLAVVVILALLGLVLTGCDPQDETDTATGDVIVDVQGMTLGDAKDALEPIGLEVETSDITGEDRSVFIEQNWIVASQDPAAGEPVGDHTTITLTIGKEGETSPAPTPGAEASTVVVPEVLGMALPDAKNRIEDAGLDVEVHDDTGQDRSVLWESNWSVTSQSLAAGEHAPPGQVITLGVLKDGEQPAGADEDVPAAPPPASPAEVEEQIARMDPETQTMINDATYLGTLELGGIDYGDEGTAIAAAHTLCGDLQAGTDPFAIRYAMIKSSMDRGAAVSGDEAQWILEAAAVAYCPDYVDAVVNSGTPR
ncbi:PASTA domain-containing protein [Rhodococcus pyridinivorans]|uniref:PASTA domain-containing protein n=1 Tax=Rhodococcus pyridinivorans TaxID=103816 RepID=UPI00265B642B|nr:PASTA domain-containing protein [Rhodococcus pyridinivorans]